MHKYLTVELSKGSYERYWKEEDAFGKFLSLPVLVMSMVLSVTLGVLVDFLFKHG